MVPTFLSHTNRVVEAITAVEGVLLEGSVIEEAIEAIEVSKIDRVGVVRGELARPTPEWFQRVRVPVDG